MNSRKLTGAPLAVRDAFAHGYSAGNYESAYETEDYNACSREDRNGPSYAPRAERDAWGAGFLLGFFASYELHEVPPEHRDAVRDARAEHGVDEDE